MKKLIILLPLFFSILCFGQGFPDNPTSGNVKWNTHNVGAFTGDLGICAGTKIDTAAWNSTAYVKTVPYIIVNTSSDGKSWIRNSTATRWDEIYTGIRSLTGIVGGGGVDDPTSNATIFSSTKLVGLGAKIEIVINGVTLSNWGAASAFTFTPGTGTIDISASGKFITGASLYINLKQ